MGGRDGDLAVVGGAQIEDLPGGPAFVQRFRAAGLGDRPPAFSGEIFDAATVIIDAVAAAVRDGEPWRPELRPAVVDAVQATATTGVTGTVGFDGFGDSLAPVFTVFRASGGEWVPEGTRSPTR